jgi:probable rRNA maturation factor
LKKGMRVEISAEVPLRRNEVRRLKRSLVSMLNVLVEGRSLELSVVLVDEQAIRELNRRYLDNDEPTDVLAFPLMSPPEIAEPDRGKIIAAEPLGDVVICIPVASRQAIQRGESRYEEIELLATHGLLHLLGHDDETESGAELMHATEKQLLGRSIVG